MFYFRSFMFAIEIAAQSAVLEQISDGAVVPSCCSICGKYVLISITSGKDLI
jgi:hypothetical protein